MVAFFLIALFGFAALSLDVGNVFREQRKEHTAADAGALAAVILLTNSPQPDVATVIVPVARDVAAANGLTDAEITAGTHSDGCGNLPGQIQAGRWNTNTGCFIADATPYNAVRVPGRRNVPLYFGPIVGLREMNPYVNSVAALTGVGSTSTNTIPLVITAPELLGKNFNDTLTINSADVGSGKWGAVNLPGTCGNNNSGYQNKHDWLADMDTLGYPGTVSVGCVNVMTGNDGIKNAFDNIPIGSVFTMPIVTSYDGSGNSSTATIIGFVVVQLSGFSGSGSSWTAQVKFLSVANGSGGGGTCDPPCIQTRALVQ